MKILIIQLRQLGDILLATPTIRELRKSFPAAKISFLSHSMGQLILEGNPLLDEHLVFPASGLWDQVVFLNLLKNRRFDLVFDFMGNPRSALLTFATRAPRRVGFRSWRRWAYTVVAPRISGQDYIVCEKFRMLSAAGIVATDQRLMLPWGALQAKVAWAYLDQEKILQNASIRIALSPTHRRAMRKWPCEQWAKLADWIVESGQGQVLWLWGPGEREEVVAIQNMCQQKTFLAPKTSFAELAALVAQFELFIGNSNGPSHVAVAVNTPSLQLHGPTDAPSWSPCTARHKVIQGPGTMDISQEAVQAEVLGLRSLASSEVISRGQILDYDAVWQVRPVL